MSSVPDQAEQDRASRAFRVLVESPFSAPTPRQLNRHISYASAALQDCFRRGELPWCSHLLYTQPGVLDDTVPAQRNLGIAAGLVWGQAADKTVVYVDLGLSRGMIYGVEAAEKAGRPVEYRGLPFNVLAQLRIRPVRIMPAPMPVSRLD